MSFDSDLLEAFLTEGRELQERALAELAALKRDGRDAQRLDSLFRAIHTLKGSTAVFDVAALTDRLHEVETRLEEARRAGSVEEGLAHDLALTLDVAERWFEVLERGETPSAALVSQTRSVATPAASVNVETAPVVGSAPWAQALADDAAVEGDLTAVRYSPAPEAFFRGEDPLAVARVLPGLAALSLTAGDPPAEDEVYDPFSCTLRILAVSTASLADVREATRLVADNVELAVVQRQASAPAGMTDRLFRNVRVDAARLDELAALVDELVIAKNGLGGGSSHGARAALDRTVGALHQAVTGLRLTPLVPLFARLPRQVREIAAGLGKEVDFVTSGERVSVDKAVAEGLFEPLLHLIRNALDHGIEAPAERVAAGKPERATLTLSAQARGDEVLLELTDDGRGVDTVRVRAKAVEKDLVSPEAAAALSEEQAAALVFTPGFSTAGEVSAVSGRGVGMDAVRAAVVQLGGRVTLESRPGRGLSVLLSLPAHVILTKVLVVEAGGQRFGTPLETVTETHRLRAAEVTPVRAGRAYIHRETVTPLLRLGDLLDRPTAADPEAFAVLLVGAGDERVGVQVDSILEQVEAPLRPLHGLLAGYPGVLGTILQGDGQVLLVLDLQEMAA